MNPGSMNGPYVTDMNTVPVPSMTYSVNGTFGTILDVDSGALQAPGTRTYTVFLFMPVVSQSNRFVNTPSLGKASGFHTFQISDPTINFITPEYVTQFSYRLQDFLQGDPSEYSTAVQTWASAIDFSFTIPQANIAGNIWTGSFQFRQMFDQDGNWSKLSVQNLVAIAQKVHRLSPVDSSQLSLKSGIVSHSVLMNAPIDFSAILGTGIQTGFNPYQAEIISYAVVENAARDITSGKLYPFTIGYNLRGNLAFFPKPQNALTNNLFRGSLFNGNTFDRPNHLAPHLQNTAHLPHMIVTPQLAKAVEDVKHAQLADGTIEPSKMQMVSQSIWSAIKSLPELIEKYGPTIVEIASLFAQDDEIRAVAPITTFTLVQELQNVRRKIKSYGDVILSQEQFIRDIDELIRLLWSYGSVISFDDYMQLLKFEPEYLRSVYLQSNQQSFTHVCVEEESRGVSPPFSQAISTQSTVGFKKLPQIIETSVARAKQ